MWRMTTSLVSTPTRRVSSAKQRSIDRPMDGHVVSRHLTGQWTGPATDSALSRNLATKIPKNKILLKARAKCRQHRLSDITLCSASCGAPQKIPILQRPNCHRGLWSWAAPWAWPVISCSQFSNTVNPLICTEPKYTEYVLTVGNLFNIFVPPESPVLRRLGSRLQPGALPLTPAGAWPPVSHSSPAFRVLDPPCERLMTATVTEGDARCSMTGAACTESHVTDELVKWTTDDNRPVGSRRELLSLHSTTGWHLLRTRTHRSVVPI